MAIPNARGYFNLIDSENDRLVISGWILTPQQELDSFKALIDGELIHKSPLEKSDQLAEAFPFLPHASRAVFYLSVPYKNPDSLLDIRIIGCSGDKEIAKLDTWYSQHLKPRLEFPSTLKWRVANNTNNAFFNASCFTSFRNYYEQVQRNTSAALINRMLDWGCGCGRLTTMFLRGTPIPAIYGCDIDHESIAWCNKNIRGGYFDVIPPLPPTRYADGLFDLVISNSVFTHLARDVQLKWLEEMRRIIAPGGLFLASVHGEFAAFFNFNGKIGDALRDDINDEALDTNLDGVAPKGYYRGTFQKRAYTERVFGQFFEIVDYVEAGSLNVQDLVVMRKPVT